MPFFLGSKVFVPCLIFVSHTQLPQIRKSLFFEGSISFSHLSCSLAGRLKILHFFKSCFYMASLKCFCWSQLITLTLTSTTVCHVIFSTCFFICEIPFSLLVSQPFKGRAPSSYSSTQNIRL